MYFASQHPQVLGAGSKTWFESRIKRLNPISLMIGVSEPSRMEKATTLSTEPRSGSPAGYVRTTCAAYPCPLACYRVRHGMHARLHVHVCLWELLVVRLESDSSHTAPCQRCLRIPCVLHAPWCMMVHILIGCFVVLRRCSLISSPLPCVRAAKGLA